MQGRPKILEHKKYLMIKQNKGYDRCEGKQFSLLKRHLLYQAITLMYLFSDICTFNSHPSGGSWLEYKKSWSFDPSQPINYLYCLTDYQVNKGKKVLLLRKLMKFHVLTKDVLTIKLTLAWIKLEYKFQIKL